MRTKKDNRGFSTFAEFRCSYGTEVRVKESSSASSPHIWLFLSEDRSILTKPELGSASAHLTVAMAKKLIRSLEKSIAEHYQLRPR